MTVSRYLGIEPVYVQPGPWLIGDNIGVSMALQMLRASQLKGTYNPGSQEFETIRNLRTIFSHTHERSFCAAQLRSVFRGKRGEVQRLSKCETQSLLFEKFIQGLLKGIGHNTRSNFCS